MKQRAIHIILLLAFIIGGFNGYAQEEELSNLDKLYILMSQSQYEIVIDIAEHVYQQNIQHPSDLSDEDMNVMRYGIMACWRKHQNQPMYSIDANSTLRTGMKYSHLISEKALEPLKQLIEDYSSYEAKTDSEKIAYLEQFHYEYNEAFPILYFMDQSTNRYYANMHHTIAVRNCEILLQGSFENKISICGIIDWDSPWLWEYGDNNTEVIDEFRILMEIAREGSKYTVREQMDMSWQIYKTMVSLRPVIQKLIMVSKQTNTTLYNETIANYLLTLNELRFFTKGHLEAFKYYETDWKKLRDELYANEIALQMFDAGMAKGFIEITKDSEIPVITLAALGSSSRIEPGSFNPYLFKYNEIYYAPVETMYNEDIIYQGKIHQKFNLYDLTRRSHNLYSHEESHAYYQNDDILMLADIDYGRGNTVKPLKESKKVVMQMQKDYGKKLKVYSGKKVTKDLFYDISEEIGILHISTHGIIDETDPNIDFESELQGQDLDSVLYMYSMGVKELQDIKLCLSGYNEDPRNNGLSVHDILTGYEEFYGLVYLDACNTGKQTNDYFASTSFAEAFFIRGATSVIAYINPINEIVAADFAQLFYQKLKAETDPYLHTTAYKWIHRVFYETKYEILQKYNDSDLLRKGAFNTPVLDIVLWE